MAPRWRWVFFPVCRIFLYLISRVSCMKFEKKKNLKSWINRCQNTLASLFFLFIFKERSSRSFSVPERDEMSADDALTFCGVGTVFICSRKESSKHTNTDTYSWIFINRNNSRCPRSSPVCSQWWRLDTIFFLSHRPVFACISSESRQKQRYLYNLSKLSWKGGRGEWYMCLFLPFAKSPNSRLQG